MKINQKNLQESLTESLKRHNVAGASAAVFYEGEITTAVGGVTNVTTGVKITADTVMHIGSITKVFTATLMMQLVDEGKVDLDERVTKYLPDVRWNDFEALENVTVKMLLNHTSGIDGSTLPNRDHDEETIEKGVERIGKLPQLFPPGTEFSYSNAAVTIAGYLAQRVLGKGWYRLIKERIFGPLNMEHAVTLPGDALLHRASIGHFLNPTNHELVRSSTVSLPLSFSPAGRLMMSASDLITFARAHMAQGTGVNGTRILSESSAKAMQQMTVNNQGKGYTYIDMGLGWMVSPDDGLLTHSGGGPGIVSSLYVYPDRRFAAAVFTNAAHGGNVINDLTEPWLKEFGNTKPMGIVDINVPSEPANIEPSTYLGFYESVASRYCVSMTSEGLMLSTQATFAPYDNSSTEATVPARLVPLGNDQFLLTSEGQDDRRSSDASRIFAFRSPDASGKMKYLGNMLRLNKRVEDED